MDSSSRSSPAREPAGEESLSTDLRAGERLAIFGLSALVFLLRLPRLIDLPIFCDEAIYLRYAQLVASDPWRNAFVSLVDPKPPLHYWLLASVFHWTADPLLAGRLLSAAAGAATIPFLFGTCLELAGRSGLSHARRRQAAWIASLFFAASPFLAFYQRLALVESLLVLESVVVAWLALALAARPVGRSPRMALALGVALGLAFLTKQNTSYLLCGLLPLAAAAVGVPLHSSEGKRWLAAAGAAVAIAVLIWSPVAFVNHGPGLRDRIFFRSAHAEVTSLPRQLSIVREAFRYVFVPGALPDVVSPVPSSGPSRAAEGGWLWLYLTPPVEIAGLAGLGWLWFSGRRRVFVFLAGWMLLMLSPLAFSPSPYPRYALPAVVPLLLAASLSLAGAIPEPAQSRLDRSPIRLLPALAAAALLIWPVRALSDQIRDWRTQPLTRLDRWQYIGGWPAGSATRQAIAALRALSRRVPLVIVTGHRAGLPTDAVWVALEGTPGVSLFFVEWMERQAILTSPSSGDWFVLRTRFHDFDPGTMMVRVPDGVPVVFVTADPVMTERGLVPVGPIIARRNPRAVEIGRWSNPSTEPGVAPAQVALYRLR